MDSHQQRPAFDKDDAGLKKELEQLLTSRAVAHQQELPYRRDLYTYIKVKGEDKYLYRAVDSTGQTIEFLLTAKRDAAAAKRFFRKALSSPGNPVVRRQYCIEL